MGVPRKNPTYMSQITDKNLATKFVLGTTFTAAISVPKTIPINNPDTAYQSIEMALAEKVSAFENRRVEL